MPKSLGIIIEDDKEIGTVLSILVLTALAYIRQTQIG
jgi:hypothetical protein